MRIKFGIDEEVKNCPFCGKEPMFYFSPTIHYLEVTIKCRNHCAEQSEFIKEDDSGFYYKNIDKTCEKIIRKWNTRAKE